jgi:hypothetical protein
MTLATVNCESCPPNNPAETPEGESGLHIKARPGRTIYLRKNPADEVAYLGAIRNVQSDNRL